MERGRGLKKRREIKREEERDIDRETEQDGERVPRRVREGGQKLDIERERERIREGLLGSWRTGNINRLGVFRKSESEVIGEQSLKQKLPLPIL